MKLKQSEAVTLDIYLYEKGAVFKVFQRNCLIFFLPLDLNRSLTSMMLDGKTLGKADGVNEGTSEGNTEGALDGNPLGAALGRNVRG